MPKYEPKYDVNMSEVYKMRMTAEQKRKLFSATAAFGTASDFYRDYDVYTAEQLLKLQAGAITAEQFGSSIASFVQVYMDATTAADDDKPKP